MAQTISEFDQYTKNLLENLRKRQRQEQLNLIYRRGAKQKVFQNTCSHPYAFSTIDENYHTGESWEETYCGVCGKLLKRV